MAKLPPAFKAKIGAKSKEAMKTALANKASKKKGKKIAKKPQHMMKGMEKIKQMMDM